MDAASDLVRYACKRLSDRVDASLGTRALTVEAVRREAEEISARSRQVSECVKAWIAMGEERELFGRTPLPEAEKVVAPTRNYFDYIAPLKHVKIHKPPESQVTSLCLLELCKDPTLEYVDVLIERAFQLNSIGVLRKDVATGRHFFEFSIPRDCDVIRDIRCSNDFEVQIGGYAYGKVEGDAILLIAAQFHEVKMKIFVEPGMSVTLSYIGSMFESEHRKTLAQSAWETNTASYRGGLVSKLVGR